MLEKPSETYMGSCEVEKAKDSIRQAVELLHYEVMLTRTAGLASKAKEVKYHHSRRREYIKRSLAVTKTNM